MKKKIYLLLFLTLVVIGAFFVWFGSLQKIIFVNKYFLWAAIAVGALTTVTIFIIAAVSLVKKYDLCSARQIQLLIERQRNAQGMHSIVADWKLLLKEIPEIKDKEEFKTNASTGLSLRYGEGRYATLDAFAESVSVDGNFVENNAKELKTIFNAVFADSVTQARFKKMFLAEFAVALTNKDKAVELYNNSKTKYALFKPFETNIKEMFKLDEIVTSYAPVKEMPQLKQNDQTASA